ncbi:MAG: glutamine synthetase III [Firmicutes bacterium]|nr:glutamine synthetase III [Bacillota bacterium]
MMKIPEIFASMVFTEETMKKYISERSYKAWNECVKNGTTLSLEAADDIAKAMCEWASEKGATHYTHWFQPMTGFTAEKHDSFISPAGKGKVILELSGSELTRGETDASSFPSGGLRATFEARGYTAWDPTSSAFIKDNTLYIPTIFLSYSGDVLDKKTPLLRSVRALDLQCSRILKLFGEKGKVRVIPQVGPEQEYFLIKKELYDQRPDLKLCGRTLFGARPPKGQELDDHYFGSIKPGVMEFMHELDSELWKLGVNAKTEHNEAAPCQHELAPVYCDVNTACDHNQITMELMQKLANRHGFECLLSEKPFAGVNGSGKHNNWSLMTDKGENLLRPGKTPSQNARFLTFIAAFLAGVDDYQEMLRCCVAYQGNDFRLGGNEAPPVIMSVSLGSELTAIVDAVIEGKAYEDKAAKTLKIGVDSMPEIPQDTTDRNRTAPMAFTGNKFEFRMVGSSQSIAGPNVVLNTMMAEELGKFADRLEEAKDFNETLQSLLQETFAAHRRIIFNGNGYGKEWAEEAKKRGLPILNDTVDSMPQYVNDKNIQLFTSHDVYSESEMRARYSIHLANYCAKTAIEGNTLSEMFLRHILPGVNSYVKDLTQTILGKKSIGMDAAVERELLSKIDVLVSNAYQENEKLLKALSKAPDILGGIESAEYYREKIAKPVSELGIMLSNLEALCGEEYWPYPTYEDILF